MFAVATLQNLLLSCFCVWFFFLVREAAAGTAAADALGTKRVAGWMESKAWRTISAVRQSFLTRILRHDW